MKESKQRMETGCRAILPTVPFPLPTCLVWSTPKAGTVYRAVACKTFPPSPTYVQEVPQSCVLAYAPAKSICLFSNTSVSRGSEGEERICSPWRPLAQMCISGKSCLLIAPPLSGLAVRFRSHYTICFSYLLLSRVDICSRGLCVRGGVLFSRGRGEGGGRDTCPCLLLQEPQTKLKQNFKGVQSEGSR